MEQINKYTEDNIKILEGLEAVRKRPSMYIGNISTEGLHHLVYEVVDNSIDEAMAGYCNNIIITIKTDNSVVVEDDGRGIPVGIHKTENKSALEVVMTKLHAGGKFDKDTYKVSGGLHGVGISVVNALSESLDVEVYKDKKIYHQRFKKGVKDIELEVIGETEKTGTKVHFKPDTTIMTADDFDYTILERRMRELAFLNKGLRIVIQDERSDEKNDFCYKGGLEEFVEYLNQNKTKLHKPILINGNRSDVDVDIAIQYNETFIEKIYTFVNNINTIEGGFHLIGFKSALTRSLNNYLAQNFSTKDTKGLKVSGDDVREGLTVIISVRVIDPQFEGQTKTKLGNSEVKGIVESLVNEKLSAFLEENPSVGKIIIKKATEAARARDAAKRARDLVRSKDNVLNSSLPGKLAACQSNKPEEKELFIVEGDSAGGSAKQGRDRKFQAILPLRGKILNVEKARFDKILKSEEIRNIITVLGTGVGEEEYDIDKIKYHKVVIMTDADVDGSHIRTLLLTFFYRQMPELIKKGFLYIAQPPLFKITKGKQEVYLKNEKEYMNFILEKFYEKTVIKNRERDFKKEEVFLFFTTFSEYNSLISKLKAKGFERELIKLLLEERIENKEYLEDKEKMEALKTKLENNDYFVDIIFNEDRQRYNLIITGNKKNKIMKTKKNMVIGRDILFSPEFKKLLILNKKTEEFNKPPFSIVEKNKEDKVLEKESAEDLYNYVLEEAKKGFFIQRYKGLGEMNPKQLWETTMSPENRNFMRVKIENDFLVDNVFSLLMGEEVEPRREFIQKNALEVSSLDF